ncbi:hypothetical protein CASFOL_020894 [Castilleja foliolosa]|uniref:Uncharacterized protein n=1 Tax=Castilleja foliolosa TaxID=1961234 RepID=A0ABD3D6J0_9LAMI
MLHLCLFLLVLYSATSASENTAITPTTSIKSTTSLLSNLKGEKYGVSVINGAKVDAKIECWVETKEGTKWTKTIKAGEKLVWGLHAPGQICFINLLTFPNVGDGPIFYSIEGEKCSHVCEWRVLDDSPLQIRTSGGWEDYDCYDSEYMPKKSRCPST